MYIKVSLMELINHLRNPLISRVRKIQSCMTDGNAAAKSNRPSIGIGAGFKMKLKCGPRPAAKLEKVLLAESRSKTLVRKILPGTKPLWVLCAFSTANFLN